MLDPQREAYHDPDIYQDDIQYNNDDPTYTNEEPHYNTDEINYEEGYDYHPYEGEPYDNLSCITEELDSDIKGVCKLMSTNDYVYSYKLSNGLCYGIDHIL